MLFPQDIKEAVLVTHLGCMDGAGCAIMFLAAGGKKENIRYLAAGQVERFVKNDYLFEGDRFLIFADIGINVPKYNDILEKRGNLAVIDHHKSSLHMKDLSWAMIDMDACGCRLLYRYLQAGGFLPFIGDFSQDAYYRFTNIIDDFDRWLLKDNRSTDMADLMTFVGQDRFVDMFRSPYLRFVDEQFFNSFEMSLLEIIGERRREAVRRCLKRVNVREYMFDGYFPVPIKIAYLISSEPYISVILDEVLKENPDCQVACMISFDRGSVSLRSRGDFDVAQLAGLFGGGGHAAASGHGIPRDVIDTVLMEIHS